MKILKKIVKIICGLLIAFFIFNSIRIYNYSSEYFETKSDVAIILGAGTIDGELSPVFKERVNHGIYLYNLGIVDYIIFTGGIGDGQTIADSEIASSYAIKSGVSQQNVLIETKSKYTFENLQEAKKLMDSNHLMSALLVSDPLHMKRSIEFAESAEIECYPSPTKTTMYKSNFPKFKFLMYESLFYTLGKIAFFH